jgi:5-oxoprolinase (ATP-hydrolysing)
VASRGHHADIGGISPGSMPANSRDLKEEGIVIDNFKLVSNGVFAEKEMVDLLSAGPYPARNVSQNISDLKAQIAANVKGEKGLKQLVRERGLGKTIQYMQHIQENSEGAVQKTLARLPVGSFECTMDDGAKICVQIRRDDTNGKTVIDFNNTSAQQPNNMNAPKAISKAAIMYVLRTLIDEDIPLSDGFLKPIEMIVPEHCLLNPDFPAAIVAGNVETSQQITDALYGAFGAMAASQGTMNNLTFGNEWYQYYETIAGGSGAGPCFDGASAVQTNMTNSRLTDPEVLENRFPVLLERFLIRSNSGGDGEYRGGDGALRQIKFLEAMTVSILSQRRSVSPHGLCGGEPGARGANYVLRRDGTRTELSSNDLTQVQPGDSVVIETPGGGGYGTPKPR